MPLAGAQIVPAQRRGGNALVLCGGGGHGALEVGFAQALEDLDVGYDRVLGTSIGALNGAFLAGGMSPADLASLWRSARLWRLVRPNWRWFVHPRTQPGPLSFSALRRFLHHTLPVLRFEDLKIPLSIVTTDLMTGKACYWEDEGEIIQPLLASMSLPGIFPPITLNGHQHIDGGIADNAALGRAMDLGHCRALMIECACASPCRRPPMGLIGILGRSFEIALARKHRAEIGLHARGIDVIRIEPRLDDESGFLDLSASQSLIEAARAQTLSELPKLLAHRECAAGTEYREGATTRPNVKEAAEAR